MIHDKLNTAFKPKVFVGMSGGVDSSVAVYLLKQEGYDVVGVFMRCWTLSAQTNTGTDADLRESECGWESDAEDARRTAEQVGIPFYIWDFEKEYKKLVVDYMVNGYKSGITPNPDVMCNREIKFGLFFNRAMRMGADYVATGHYVKKSELRSLNFEWKSKIKNQNSKFRLFAAKDAQKDQSYFLWTLTQKELKHCLFPVGNYLKSEVRAIAKKAGLITAAKKDSQGICFVGQVTISDFLKQYIPERKGVVLNAEGEIIGEHSGAEFYTIGQRHGFIINQKFLPKTDPLLAEKVKNGGISPHYVVKKNIKRNTLTVTGKNDAELLKKKIKLMDLNFINQLPAANSQLPVFVRVRYRQPLTRAKLIFPRKSVFSPRQSVLLVFEQNQKFIAPGQSAVFYSEKGEVLGGGVIV